MKKQQNSQKLNKKDRITAHVVDYTQSQRLKTETSTYIHTPKERAASLKKIYCVHAQGASTTTDYYITKKWQKAWVFSLPGSHTVVTCILFKVRHFCTWSVHELTLSTSLIFSNHLTCPDESHKLGEEKVMFTLVEQHIHVETVTPAKLMHSHRKSLRHPHLTLITAEALNWLIDIVLIILQPTETVLTEQYEHQMLTLNRPD